MEFYNLRTKQRVEVPESQIKKQSLRRTTSKGAKQVRYQVVAEVDGSRMFKFVNQTTYTSLDVPELS